jgi:penicillin-binding protein 1A
VVEEDYGDNEMSLDDVFNAVGDFVEGSGIETEVAPSRDRLPPDDEGLPGDEPSPPPRGRDERREDTGN